MANTNVTLDLMSGGSLVAVDNIGGTSHQQVKVEFGASGVATPVDASNPLPSSIINGTIAVNTPGTITSGTVSVNTPGTITSGSIAVTAGTINSGSITVVAGTVGTVAAVGQIHNAGTIQGGTLGVVSNVTNGSIVVTAGTVGTVGAIGQVHNAGTIAGGTLGRLTDGTVRIPAGSISVIAGTIGAGTINTLGTLTNLVNGTIQNSGTTTGVGVVSALTSGTVSVNTPGTITSGTISVNTPGTITSGTVAINAGTVGGKAASGAAAQANPIQIAGTDSGGTIYSPLVTTTGAIGSISSVAQVHNAGTITTGSIANIGFIHSIGTMPAIAVGDISGGTIDEITNGTIRVTAGTVAVNTPGTITSGSISVIAGTVGTVANVGVVHNAGTIASGSLANIGFIHSIGTMPAITIGDISGGTIDEITNGSIVVTAGTVALATGTNTVGKVRLVDSGGEEIEVIGSGDNLSDSTLMLVTHSRMALFDGSAWDRARGDSTNGLLVNLGSNNDIVGTIAINAGTVGGKAASGAVAEANPIQIAGTDSGGTIYSPLINTAGAGTVSGVGTLPGVGVVSQITNGSIVITAGTVTSLASGTTIGTINAGTINSGTINAGTINAGTFTPDGGTIGTIQYIQDGAIQITSGSVANVAKVHNAGTIADGTLAIVTAVSNLTNGTVRVTAGTVAVTTPGTITSGSIAVTAGTVNAGTINAGTINSGTINAGTFTGTVQINPNTSQQFSIIGSIWGTSSGTAGTIISAPTSGSAIHISDLSIVNEGTSTLTAGMGFGTGQQGTTVLVRAAMAGNGGIQKSFAYPVTGGGTQLPLVIWTTGSGTAAFNASYFIAL